MEFSVHTRPNFFQLLDGAETRLKKKNIIKTLDTKKVVRKKDSLEKKMELDG